MEHTIIKLRNGQCRYPTTDLPRPVDSIAGLHHLFCGQPAQDGSAYCAGHHSICNRGQGRSWQYIADLIARIERGRA